MAMVAVVVFNFITFTTAAFRGRVSQAGEEQKAVADMPKHDIM